MKAQELKNDNKYEIFVDLDGVLFDFDAGVNNMFKALHINKTHSQQRYNTDSNYRSKMWSSIAKFQKDHTGFWESLPLMSDAKELWNYVSKYPHEILTATGQPHFKSGEQKERAVKKHFGSVKVNLVRNTADKAKFAQPDRILIDDRKKAIDPWIKAGGIGILHKSADLTIKELKKLGL